MAVTKYATEAIYREGGKKKTAVQVMQERTTVNLQLMKHSSHIVFDKNHILDLQLQPLKEWPSFNRVEVKGEPNQFFLAALTINPIRARTIGLELINGEEEQTFRSGEGDAAASYDELTSLNEKIDYVISTEDNIECRAYRKKIHALQSVYSVAVGVCLDNDRFLFLRTGLKMLEWRLVANYLRSYRDSVPQDPIVIGDHEFQPINGRENWIRMPASLANGTQQQQLFEVCKHVGLFCALVSNGANEAAERIIIVSKLYQGVETYPHRVIDKTFQRVDLLSKVRKPWLYRQLESDCIEDAKAKTVEWVRAVKSIELFTVWQDKFLKCPDLGIAGQDDVKTNITVVSNLEGLCQCVEVLKKTDRFGVDLELVEIDGLWLTCLLQLSVEGEDFVLDVLEPKVREHIYAKLDPFFRSWEYLKIFHSMDALDIPSLFRDFGLVVVNAVDSQLAWKKLKGSSDGKISLLRLLDHYHLGNSDELKLMKDKYQQHDWAKRPLDDEQAILYAAKDARFLIPLWGLLSKAFAKVSTDRVLAFVEECATICEGKLGDDDRLIIEPNSRTMLEMTLDKYNLGVRWDANSQRLYDALVKERRQAALRTQVSLVEISTLSFLACLVAHSPQLPQDIKRYTFLSPSEVSTNFQDGIEEVYRM